MVPTTCAIVTIPNIIDFQRQFGISDELVADIVEFGPIIITALCILHCYRKFSYLRFWHLDLVWKYE